MSTSLLLVIVFFMFIWTHISAEILSGSQSNLGSLIDVTVAIDTSTDTVDIEIIGPSDKWFGVGFGSDLSKTNSMIDSYAILAYATDIVTEHKLLASGSGTALSPGMITVNSDTTNAATSTRTIQMTRNRAATSQQQTDGFYSFPTVSGDFPFLWGYGLCVNPCNSLNNVRKHGGTQRAKGTFSVLGTPEPTTTEAPTQNPSKNPTNPPVTSAPTQTGYTNPPTTNPTFNPTSQPTNIPTHTPTKSPTTNPTNIPTAARVPDPRFEVCTETLSVASGAATIGISIGRTSNVTQQIMIIDMFGPLDKWFGFGFDDAVSDANTLQMQDTYAVTVGGNAMSEVVERILGNWDIGSVVSPESYLDLVLTEESGMRRVQMIRAWQVDNTYDFTSFMQCGASSIGIISATGGDTVVTDHTARGRNIVERICACEGVTEPPTRNPVTSTTVDGCEQNGMLKAEGSLNEFAVAVEIDCEANTVLVDITYSQYDENWFGFVFSDSMIGTALLWTTHNAENGETARDLGLYQYLITDATANMVKYDTAATQWTQVSETINAETINIVYTQSAVDSFIGINTKELQLRWAKGNDNGLEVSYHGVNGRSSATLTLDLVTGKAVIVKDDISLQIAHGVIMWVAWSVLASVGVMSSAFRFLYPKGPKWFFAHRGVQCAVVVLGVIGFVLAVVFTQQKGHHHHFDNAHTIIGLVVTLLGILQPINAYFRSHPPANGWSGGIKPRKRAVWEFIHKACGYIAWILGCIAAMLGLKLIGEDTLAYVHMFGYCGVLLALYIALSIIKYIYEANYTQISNNSQMELAAPKTLQTTKP